MGTLHGEYATNCIVVLGIHFYLEANTSMQIT